MSFSVTENIGGKVILRIKSDLDTYGSSLQFKDALEDIYKSGEKEVVLDLDMVTRINSFGTGKILMFYRRFKNSGGDLYVKTPLNENVKEVFEELKIDKLLKEFS